jgi:hypothetical protein
MIALLAPAFALALGLPSTAGPDPAAAARLEADAFTALEQGRPCAAATAFLAAHEVAHDARLLFNAGLAFERAGDVERATATFARVDPSALPAVGARQRKLQGARSTTSCPAAAPDVSALSPEAGAAAAPVGPVDDSARALVEAVVEPRPHEGPAAAEPALAAAPPSAQGPALLPWGIAALTSGAVVAGGALGAWAYGQHVLHDPRSLGTAKEAALASSAPILVVGSSVGGLLLLAGSALVPLSIATIGTEAS